MLSCTFLIVAAKAQQASVENLKNYVYTLADDSLRGRWGGSPDSRKAADFIVKQYDAMGLPMWNGKTYFQEFAINEHYFRNILGVIEGNDPLLKNEYIIIGAHYDHIGVKKNVRNGGDSICNGADDNASGTASVMEIARILLQNRDKLKRSVIIANFDGEEQGLFGSTFLSEHCIVPLENVKLMISADMVGYLATSGFLKYVGVGTIENGAELIKSIPWNDNNGTLKVKDFEGSVFTATDTRGFAQKQVPTLYVTTGLKSPYHKVGDEADGIDYEGLAKVTDHLSNLVLACAADEDFKASGKVASIHEDQSEKAFYAGYVLGMGSSSLYYEDGPLTGKTAFDGSLGVYSRLYLGKSHLLALRLDADYERFVAPTELGRFKTHAVLVPARLEFTIGSSSGVSLYVNGGAYYRYFLAAKLDNMKCDFTDFKHDDYGWLWGVGMNVKNSVFFESTHYYGLQNPLIDNELDQHFRTSAFTIGIKF